MGSSKRDNLGGTFDSSDEFYTLDKLMKYRETRDLKLKLIKEWKGHKLGVTGVTSHHEPIFFASSGQDLKIVIWNKDFEQIGTLTTIRDPNWNLKIDVEKKNKEKREAAKELYDQLKTLSYEGLFDGNMNLQPIDVKFYLNLSRMTTIHYSNNKRIGT